MTSFAWISILLIVPAVWSQAAEDAPEARAPYFPPPPPPPPPPRPYPPPPPPGQYPPRPPPPQQYLPPQQPQTGGAPPPPPPLQQQQQQQAPPPPLTGGGSGGSGDGEGGGGGGFGAGAGAAMGMAVVDTVVVCQSRNMRVDFSMSAPFHGIIYPYNHFHNCLLHEGNGETRVNLLLGHGTCANENGLQPDGTLAPVIEHRLMIQWDREIVEEWDSSIIVRCDRPEDYNKTIRFDLSTLDEAASFVSSTHPGPQMWMEIQKGEGPNAPELQGSVFLGQVLTLVFTLADEHFDFDTNVLTCWALDGEADKRRIEWLTPQPGVVSGGGGGSQLIQQRRYTGEMEVINQGCSAKPKVFGHFNKVSGNFNNKRSMTQFAFFKAFRFPTSSRVVIQCNVQVCYRKCQELRPCSESYNPRAALPADQSSRRRRRRQAEEPADERVNLVRSIEVRLPEEAADLPPGDLPPTTTTRVRYTPADGLHCPQCTSLTTFFIVLVSLAALLAVLVSAVLWVYVRRQHGGSSLRTPTK